MSTKHRAILHVKLEVHSLLDSNECSGYLVEQEELQQFGLKPRMIFAIDGPTKEECLRFLSLKLKELNSES